MMLSRSTAGSGGPFTTIYSGQPTPVYIDTGDGLPTPLASGSAYTYKLDDANGTTFSTAITPALTLNIEQEPLLAMLLRLFQAGINNLVPPVGISKIPAGQVIAAMPLTGFPPLPIVTVNLDRMGQTRIPVGADFENVDNGTGIWTMTSHVERDFRITILTSNVTDRDFYRDAIAGIFRSIMLTVFEPIGQNVSHRFQVVSGQIANDPNGQAPGFFYADVHAIMDGTFNISITPSYGLISHLDMTAHVSGAEVEVVLPLTP